MKPKDILGYVCLIIAFLFYGSQENGSLSLPGLFFNSMALGFFVSGIIDCFKNKKKQK